MTLIRIRTEFMSLAIIGFVIIAAVPASAQQKIGYVDSEYILSLTPEYGSVQQQLDRTAEEGNTELEEL